jgi:hypothetical protein
LVEEGLVPDDVARHAADPLRVELRRQLQQVERRERWISVALEDDVAAPNGALELALTEHVGREAVARAQRQQAGVGDRELLVRRGDQREAEVLGVELLARDEIDGDGRRARFCHVRDRERPGEAPRERRLSGRGGGLRSEKRHSDEDGEEAAHRHILKRRLGQRKRI